MRAKVFAWSTISGDVLSPPENPPPCTHTIAGRATTRSPVGSYTSSRNVTVRPCWSGALP